MQVGIVGASGLVGGEIIKLLENVSLQLFPYLMSSDRSTGKTTHYKKATLSFKKTDLETMLSCDVLIFSAGSEVSKKFIPELLNRGKTCIDLSSAFRAKLPSRLVIPEINKDLIHSENHLYSSPNCTTTLAAIALFPIFEKCGIKRVIISSYQAASGGGQNLLDALINQTKSFLNTSNSTPEASENQYAFNFYPHPVFSEGRDDNVEEEKIKSELKTLFRSESLKVSATCVRVPSLRCHGLSINFEITKPSNIHQITKLLEHAPGITLCKDPKMLTSLRAHKQHSVFVGRLREDKDMENCFNMWVVGDQLLKGAALNAVQILEHLVEQNLQRTC